MPAGLGTLFVGLLLIVLAFVEGDSVWKSAHQILFGLFGCGSFVLGAAVCYLAILYTRGQDLLMQVFKLLLGLIFASGTVIVFSDIPADLTAAQMIAACYQNGANAWLGGGVLGTLLGGNLLNIVGNYVLIYGKFGFPELGLYGAGLSTMFSRIVMAVAFCVVFFGTRRYRVYRQGFHSEPINSADISHLCKIGFPLSLQMGMEAAAFSLSSIMVGWIGTTALAAHQVMLTISQFFYMVYYGMGSAVAVRASYFTGQHDYTAVRRTASAGFHLILAIAVAVSVPVVIWRNSLGFIFTDSPQVCTLVAQVILPLIIYQFGDGMQCTYGNALRGIAYVKPLMYTAFLAYFVISLPLGYLFGIKMGLGLLGIWFAFPFGLTTAGLLYYYYFHKRLKEVWPDNR